jgi:hypothetical protein
VTDPGARPSFEDRLTDPASHFPYKHDAALRAAGGDPAAEAEVDATAAYVKAQEDYLRNPGEETRADERAAAKALQDVRADRRFLRGAPALVQALSAEVDRLEELADRAESGDEESADLDEVRAALEAAEAALRDAIERTTAAAERFGILPADEDEGA